MTSKGLTLELTYTRYHYSHPSFVGFLFVPKVKFLFARLFYIGFCVYYFLYIQKRSNDLMNGELALSTQVPVPTSAVSHIVDLILGNIACFSVQDFVFFGWSFTLLLDEMHQVTWAAGCSSALHATSAVVPCLALDRLRYLS